MVVAGGQYGRVVGLEYGGFDEGFSVAVVFCGDGVSVSGGEGDCSSTSAGAVSGGVVAEEENEGEDGK